MFSLLSIAWAVKQGRELISLGCPAKEGVSCFVDFQLKGYRVGCNLRITLSESNFLG
jgi:hypothetical protein